MICCNAQCHFWSLPTKMNNNIESSIIFPMILYLCMNVQCISIIIVYSSKCIEVLIFTVSIWEFLLEHFIQSYDITNFLKYRYMHSKTNLQLCINMSIHCNIENTTTNNLYVQIGQNYHCFFMCQSLHDHILKQFNKY